MLHFCFTTFARRLVHLVHQLCRIFGAHQISSFLKLLSQLQNMLLQLFYLNFKWLKLLLVILGSKMLLNLIQRSHGNEVIMTQGSLMQTGVHYQNQFWLAFVVSLEDMMGASYLGSIGVLVGLISFMLRFGCCVWVSNYVRKHDSYLLFVTLTLCTRFSQ